MRRVTRSYRHDSDVSPRARFVRERSRARGAPARIADSQKRRASRRTRNALRHFTSVAFEYLSGIMPVEYPRRDVR